MPTTFSIPDPESGWTVISGSRVREEGIELGEAGRKHSDLVVGIPSSQVTTFTVELPSVDAGLLESMIFAQAEKRGLVQAGEGETRIDFRSLGETTDGNEAYAVTVASRLTDDLVVPGASGYHLAGALRPVPAGGGSLWKEHGRLVLGLYDEGELLHLQVLSGASEVGAAAAGEISLSLLGLEGDPVLGKRLPESLELQVPTWGAKDLEGFRNALKRPVIERNTAKLDYPRPSSRDRLLPSAVTRFRRRAALVRRLLFAGGVIGIVYAATLSFLWIHSKRTAARIDSLEKRIAIVEPDVERIQAIEQRWNRLEPSFEKKWFPVVQLSRITSALPSSGVVIREFRTSGREIRVQGQARDAQLAKRLFDDLSGMQDFSHYDWTMPNPTLQQNNTASFRIEGKPKNAGTDE